MLGKFRPVEQNAALNNRLRWFPDHSQLPIASARADVDDNWNIDRTRAIKLPYLDGEATQISSAPDPASGRLWITELSFHGIPGLEVFQVHNVVVRNRAGSCALG